MSDQLYQPYRDLVRPALKKALAVVPGLAQYDAGGEVVNILDYEPGAVLTSPLVYSLLDGFSVDEGESFDTVTYRTQHFLCVDWGDPQGAEDQLVAFVDSIPAAIRRDRTLGGRVRNATITGGDTDWPVIGGIEVRALKFMSEVTILIE
jgi:hypothetical protein